MARDIGGAGDLDLHDTGVCSGRVRMVGVCRGLCGRLLQFAGDLWNGGIRVSGTTDRVAVI